MHVHIHKCINFDSIKCGESPLCSAFTNFLRGEMEKILEAATRRTVICPKGREMWAGSEILEVSREATMTALVFLQRYADTPTFREPC